MVGSPMFKFLSTVHGKLNNLATTNLKILFTLMLWVALEKNSVAFIALAHALACSNNTKIPAHFRTNIVLKDYALLNSDRGCN